MRQFEVTMNSGERWRVNLAPRPYGWSGWAPRLACQMVGARHIVDAEALLVPVGQEVALPFDELPVRVRGVQTMRAAA